MKAFYFKIIIGAGLMSMMIMGCDTKIEDCLDASATNFNPIADNNCCCTYPELQMQLSYNLYSRDSSGFALNTTYNDDFGNPFQITNIPFYISQFQVIDANGNRTGVTDEVTLYLNDGTTQTVEDNFNIVKTNTFRYSIGTFSATGDYTQIRFLVGLDATANQTVPDSMEATHPLAISSDSLYVSNTEGYIFTKAEVITDTSTTTTTTYTVQGDANLVEVILDAPITIAKGVDTRYEINVDFLKLFEGVNFQTDDATTISTKIQANTGNIFQLE